MRASTTAKLLKWGCSTQSVSHNGFGIDRSYPRLTPDANKPRSTAEIESKKCYVNAGKNHTCSHTWRAEQANTTHTGADTSSRSRGTCTHKRSAGRFSGMIGRGVRVRLRPVERPIWPHFDSDGSADRFPASESPGGWSHKHTHTRMYSRCVCTQAFLLYTWINAVDTVPVVVYLQLIHRQRQRLVIRTSCRGGFSIFSNRLTRWRSKWDQKHCLH